MNIAGRNTTTEAFAPGCFVCDGARDPRSEDPPRWLRLRAACAAHKAEARLANGARLADLLEGRGGAHPIEGSALARVVNPVTIGGVRGFADFAAGGWAVLEEVFHSRNWLEFTVLHDDRWVDGLFAVHGALRADPASSPAQLLVAISTAMPTFSLSASLLSDHLSPPASPAALVALLRDLAQRRFAHLP